jgi:radical SAM protein with 4Fe4S-binding SPASM domain
MDLIRIARFARSAYHWKIASSSALPYAPEEVSIEVTNTCNYRCCYCLQSDSGHTTRIPRTSLSVEQAETLLTRIRRGGVKTDAIHWGLDGEPFMNKELHTIWAAGHRFGFMHAVFATNGLLLGHERLAALPRPAGSTYLLTIDFCSDREHFERIRGTPGSWQRTVNNIVNSLADDALGNISFVLTDIASYGESDRARLAAKHRELKQLFPASARLRFATRTFHNATGFLKTQGARRSPAYFGCPYPWSHISVASNGDVLACSRDLQHKTVLGNLFQQELGEIWNGAEAARMRVALATRKPELITACAACDIPWDAAKFSGANLWRTTRNRLGLV